MSSEKLAFLSTIQPLKPKDLYLLDVTSNIEISTQRDGTFDAETIASFDPDHEYQVLGAPLSVRCPLLTQ